MTELTSRSDVKAVEQSLRGGWEIPERAFADLPARLIEIIVSREDGGNSGPYVYSSRMRLSAIRCLTMMHGQNLAANPAPQEVRVSQSFEFDMSVAESMSRDEMEAVSRALGITNGKHEGNGRHNGNGQHPAADS